MPFPVEASATDRRTLIPDEHQAETRNTQARVHEVDNRVDVLEAQVAALIGQLREVRGEFHELRTAVVFRSRIYIVYSILLSAAGSPLKFEFPGMFAMYVQGK